MFGDDKLVVGHITMSSGAAKPHLINAGFCVMLESHIVLMMNSNEPYIVNMASKIQRRGGKQIGCRSVRHMCHCCEIDTFWLLINTHNGSLYTVFVFFYILSNCLE